MYANLRPLSKDLGKPLSFKASINKRAHPWYRYAHFQSKIHTSYSDWLNRRSPYRYPHSSALEFNPYQHLSWIETVEVPIKVRMIHLRTSAPSVGNSSSCFFFFLQIFFINMSTHYRQEFTMAHGLRNEMRPLSQEHVAELLRNLHPM